MDADKDNLQRTAALVTHLRAIAQTLRACGWDDRICDQASRVKRRVRLGDLMSWADGWTRKQVDLPVGGRVLKKIHLERGHSPNRLLAAGLARTRILLDEVMSSRGPGQKAPPGSDAYALTFRSRRAPDRPRARTVADDLDAVANVIASAIETADPVASPVPAAGTDDLEECVDAWPRATEVAKRLGISKGQVTRLCQAGKLDSRKRGGVRRVNPASVLQHAARNDIHLNETHLREMRELLQTMAQFGARGIARRVR